MQYQGQCVKLERKKMVLLWSSVYVSTLPFFLVSGHTWWYPEFTLVLCSEITLGIAQETICGIEPALNVCKESAMPVVGPFG